ncbi:LPS-assembly protein LptD [Algirhabdus cladophorae]|uniref:LPS-assembly protein LptD n=1 Tax=Algirhabdus cladophorae TaxID=3377108 RepID=UPI003B84A71B
MTPYRPRLPQILAAFASLWLTVCTSIAMAQEASPDLPATLIADSVTLSRDNTLTASGNVEILYDTTRLRAASVRYDQRTDTLAITGPITVIEGDSTIILADSADLSPSLQTGILRGARVVFDQQLQVAANRLEKVNARYTQMNKIAASSCQVCGPNDVPLWQIRARRLVHDVEEKQLYFDDATFRIFDVPVFYLPRLRLPDPSLKRARGFLTPVVTSTSLLGFGLKLPYFIPIGDHKDLTLTPYISTKTRTLEFRYRQAFRTGRIEINGAVSRDNLTADDMRGYLFANGSFALAGDFNLSFDIETVTEDTYLRNYDYTSKSRLDSRISVTRTRDTDHFEANLIYFESLRNDEVNQTLPSIVGNAQYMKRVRPLGFGTLDLSAEVLSLHRESETDGISGRDVTRTSAAAHWHNTAVFGPGLLARADLALYVDHFDTVQDSNFESSQTRVTPYAAAELRWPVASTGVGGVRHVLEPFAQVVWTQDSTDDVPVEESTSQELDEGNLFAFNRSVGQDQIELGGRATLGLSYTRYDPRGWSIGLTMGRSLRQEDYGQFTRTSGLAGQTTDWLAAFSLKNDNGLSLINRAIFDDSFSVRRSETELRYSGKKFSMSSGYIWLARDAQANREISVSEWIASTDYQINKHWSTSADWRYDSVFERTQNAGLGLKYRNECIEMGLSLSRRFTSSASLEPDTKLDLSVALKGFSTGGRAGQYAHTCN